MSAFDFRLALKEKLDVLSVGETVEAILGYKPREFLSAAISLEELIHSDDAARTRSLFSSHATDKSGEVNVRMRHADGRMRCMNWRYKREKSREGFPILQLKVCDATCMETATATFSSGVDLTELMDGMGECAYVKNQNHVITRANQGFRKMFSDSSQELRDVIGLCDYDLFSEEYSDHSYEFEEQVLAGETVAFDLQETIRGKKERLEHRKFPVRDHHGQIAGLLTIVAVTTNRVLAKQALLANEESFSDAQKLAGIGSFVLDIQKKTWTASDVLYEILGLEKDCERSVAAWIELVLPEDLTRLSKLYGEANLHKAGTLDEEIRFLRQTDKTLRWARVSGRLELDAQGEAHTLRGSIEDISARKLVESEVRKSAGLLELFIQDAPAGIAMFDLEMRYIRASRRWIEDMGIEAWDVVGHSRYELGYKIPERWKEDHRRALQGETISFNEDSYERQDGSERWVRRMVQPWWTGDAKVGGIVVLTEDITERKASEDRLRLPASVFTHASEGILITDPNGVILDANEAFSRTSGYSHEELLGRNASLFDSGRQTKEFYAEMWSELREKGQWSGEIWNRSKDGQIFPEMLKISAVPDGKGHTKQFVAMYSDLTRIKATEKQLRRVAHFDRLTGLPNRTLLAERMWQAMARSRHLGCILAVAYLDLDDFHAINDCHGCSTGDQLLTAISHRLSDVLREGDTLARLGGDEFAVVLLEIASIDESLALIGRLRDAVAEPVQLGGLILQVTASIGVTFYPQTEDVEPDQLLRQADQAMYCAKLAGRSRFHVFDPTLDRSMRGRHEDLQRIRQAIRAQEFELYFQPRVNMCTGAILSAEALIRWRHPELGLLLPDHFLPVVEGNLLIVELGEWVIGTALSHMERWREEGLDIHISVNVDGMQLQSPRFVERLKELLDEHPRIEPSRLEMEVLESSAFQDLAQVSDVIRDCNKLGVSFALDDFGTGYSSLSYLKRLPVDVLKIDRTFVHDMLDDPEYLTILGGMLVLANAFRRRAVAEGVETVDHGLMLLQLGCPVAQGFGIARPMPGSALPAWAAHWRPDPRWANVTAVNQEKWPLLYATVEHRAWVDDIEQFIAGHRLSAPGMDHRLCRFGSWLDAETTAGRGGQSSIRAMDALHRKLHAHGNEILQLKEKTSESLSAASDELKELHTLRDGLIEELQQSVQMA